MFQSTRPRGARQQFNPRGSFSPRFNPRAHAGRDAHCVQTCRDNRRFNPRAHAGRDTAARQRKGEKDVSIHAPTRGATPETWQKTPRSVFQSTRPRGARHVDHGYGVVTLSFNPRAHAGRDPLKSSGKYSNEPFQSTRPRGARRLRPLQVNPGHNVSIHAPTRGATRTLAASARLVLFQSTRPRGARPKDGGGQGGAYQFQSTRPRGARRRPGLSFARPRCFNPRAHAGRDPLWEANFGNLYRFNPRAHAGRDPASRA